jgi:uncharacterized protein
VQAVRGSASTVRGTSGSVADVANAPVIPDGEPMAPVRQRLREALRAAMKASDRTATAVLRSALAAIDNAEAVDGPRPGGGGLAIEQTPLGVGAAEVTRRVLTEAEVVAVVRGEMAERASAARDCERLGRTDHAARLRAEAGVLSAYVDAG